MKTIRRIPSSLLASVVFALLPHSASAMGPSAVRSAGALYLQESGAGAPLGKLNVPARMMANRCITMVSPTYPQMTENSRTPSTVIVRVVIWKSGGVTPLQVISGRSALQAAAMSAVKGWAYKPFDRDGEPLDVTTDISVDFDPATPGGVVTHPNR
jgi:TonB family protein